MLRIFAHISSGTPTSVPRSRVYTALLLTLTVLFGLSFSGIANAKTKVPEAAIVNSAKGQVSKAKIAHGAPRKPLSKASGQSKGQSKFGKVHPNTSFYADFSDFSYNPSYSPNFSQTIGVTVDVYGDVYVADVGTNTVYMETPIAAGGYTQSVVASGFTAVSAVTVDSSLNVYVSDWGAGTVYIEAPQTGGGYVQSVVDATLVAPAGIAVDYYGDVFVADTTNGVIEEVNNGGGSYTATPIWAGYFDSPNAVALDGYGNLYVGDYIYQNISDIYSELYSIPNYGGGSWGTPNWISDDFWQISGLSVLNNGTIYVTDAGFYEYPVVYSMIPSQQGFYSQFQFSGNELEFPIGGALDSNGNYYVADEVGNFVEVFSSNFGAVYAGYENNLINGPVQANFYVYGSGTLGPVQINTQGGGSFAFANAGSELDSCSGTVYTGTSAYCSVQISFSPTGPGILTGGVVLNDNAGNFVGGSPSFTGTGIAPRSSFFPGTWSYITNGNTETDAKSGFAKRRQAAHLKVPKTPEVQPDFIGSNDAFPYPGDSPNGIVVDQNGNYFVADDDTYNDCAIYAYFPNSVYNLANPTAQEWVSLPLFSGLCPSGGLAVDGAGNVFYSAWYTYDNGAVVAYDANLGFDATTGTNTYSAPLPAVIYTNTGSEVPWYINNIAVDAYDNVYFTGSDDSYTDAYPYVAPFASFSNYTIFPDYFAVSQLNSTTPFDYLTGIAVDNYGDIALTDYDLGQVFVEFPESNGTYSQYTIARGLDTPVAVQWTPVGGIYGGLYVVDSGDDTGVSAVYLYSYNGLYTNLSEGFTLTPLAISPWYEGGGAYFSGFSNDPSGNLWLTDDGFLGGLITEINVNTPPSLNFATTDVGLVSTDSPQTVFLADTGNDTLVLPVPSSGFNPSISPNFLLNSSSFSYAPGGTTPVADCPLISSSSADGAYIYPDTPCALPVSFAPLMAGPITGTLVVTDNSLYGSSAVPLAKGAKPAIKGFSSVRMARGKLAKGLDEPTSTPVSQTINLTGIGVDYFSITFTVTGSPVPPVVKAGGSLSLSFTVAPTAPATYFPLPVVMSAGGGPDGTSYVFNPAVVPAGSGSTTVVLTLNIPIQYVARNEAPAAPGQNGGTKLPVAPLALALLLLPMAGKLRKAGKRMNRLAAMLLLAIAGLTATATLIGCGANKAAVYYITVTGTSGALSNSTSFDITVQGR